MLPVDDVDGMALYLGGDLPRGAAHLPLARVLRVDVGDDLVGVREHVHGGGIHGLQLAGFVAHVQVHEQGVPIGIFPVVRSPRVGVVDGDRSAVLVVIVAVGVDLLL